MLQARWSFSGSMILNDIPSTEEAKQEEQSHLKSVLQGFYGYKPWTFKKALKPSLTNSKTTATKQLSSSSPRHRDTTIPYILGLSEKVRRIYKAIDIIFQVWEHNAK